MSDSRVCTLDMEDGLAVLTLNRPDSLNALNKALKSELTHMIRTVGKPDSGARALLITGAGRGFSSGADLMEAAAQGGAIDPGADLIDSYNPLMNELAALPLPVVTAINGVAAGAGMSLAVAGDIAVAARSARFIQSFVKIGLVPDAGSSHWLPRLIGLPRARAMMMLGEEIPAQTAKDWGLIYDVVDDDSLMDRARLLARQLAEGPTIALGQIRQLLNRSTDNSYATQLQAEAEAQRIAGRSKDCKEGVMAFAARKAPNFTGS
ncbi:enoyl-CoA hydratase-related protein [Yunchengibacter salinarum]|uniref:enoyl-CoA hydratase-related protein n=1 Tax=Yunchengibacter salinarum TaxID=3133399 RepID=UPI0035B585C5